MKKKTSCPKGSCSASTSSSMVKRTRWQPKGSSTSCSTSTSSSMVKKTSWQPKGSSTSCSASTSSSMVKKTSSPKDSSSSSVSRNPPATTQSYDGILQRVQKPWSNEMGSGKKQINGVQEQKFTFMGSSSSSNPRIAEDEFQRYSAFKKNNRPTTTHVQSMASLASINGGDLLIQFQDWSVERVLKIRNNDPSLLDEIEPKDIVMVAELKLGSLYLQKILKDYPLYFNKIFYATLNLTYPLMFDPEGTYVLRKLYDLCDSNHLKLIVEKILSCPELLISAAKNDTGSGTLMKLIEVLKSSTNLLLLKSILYAFNSEFLSMMTSKHGSSLFRFFFKDLDPPQNEILYIIAATHCIDLATDASGYASLIALVENIPNPYKKVLLLKIIDNAAYLSQDPKGNYVIQATLLQDLEVDCMICTNLAGTYLCLSRHKYANNVVQKCIISSGMEHPILELIYSRELHLLSKDRVGNFVVQKALTVTQFNHRDLYNRLVGQIQPYLKDLQHHPIGRYVFKLINKKEIKSS